jgi:hypothetical protein
VLLILNLKILFCVKADEDQIRWLRQALEEAQAHLGECLARQWPDSLVWALAGLLAVCGGVAAARLAWIRWRPASLFFWDR